MPEAGLAKLYTQGAESAMGLPVAISQNSVLTGDVLNAVIAGEIESNGSFIAGTIYWAGASGTLVISPPATGIVLRVGAARTNDVLVVDFSEPIMQG